MIKLNLLPPQEKELLRLAQIQRWIILYGSAILLSSLIFIFLLSVIWFSLFIELKSLDASLSIAKQSSQGQDLKAQQGLVEELNAQIERISRFQKTHKTYSAILISLANMLPSDVKIIGLTINKQNKMSINGFAQRREGVLALQKSLKNSAIFTDVSGPLSNLTKQTNINFSFTMTIQAK